MAAVTAPATTYEYGGAQQGYNPYDAYSHGGASAYQWPQPNAAPAQPQQAKAAPQRTPQQYGQPAQQQTWATVTQPAQKEMWGAQQQQQGQWPAQTGQSAAWGQGAYAQQGQWGHQTHQQGGAGQGAPASSDASATAGGAMPASVTDPSGYGVWEPQKDLKTGKIYWTNHALQKTAWDPPKGGTAVVQQAAGHAPAPPTPQGTAEEKQPGVGLAVAPGAAAAAPGAAAGAWGQQTAGAWGQQGTAEWGQQPATATAAPAPAAGAWGQHAGYGYAPYAAQTGAYAGYGHAANTSYNQQYAAAGHAAQQAPGSTAPGSFPQYATSGYPAHQQQSATGVGYAAGQQTPANAAAATWAQQSNAANVAKPNAFAWKTPTPKSKPQALSTDSQYQWDDGRDSRDDEFPPLGSAGTRNGERNGYTTPSINQQGAWGQSTHSSANSSPYKATPQGTNSNGGGYLGQASQQAQSGAAAPPADKWPPKLQTFVENSFKQCNGEYERTCMQNTLKAIIQNATKNNKIWTTDWDSQPLPRVSQLPTGSTKDSSSKKDYDEDKWVNKKSNNNKKMRRKEYKEVAYADLDADREAREKRHKRFIDMERGYTNAASGMTDLDGETKFMSSEAIEGTCMEMEKMYIRLQSMPDPASVRPERVLVKWAERLQVKYDTEEADWEWISDQFKAIRQDMVIQHIRSANAVTVYETNGRLALQEQDYPEFYKVQSFLMGLYKDNEDARHNEHEFMAYRLFYWMLNNNTVDMTKDIRNMGLTLKKHRSVVHAIALHQALELSDYVSFFRLYAETPNNGKCIVDTLRDRMRTRSLRVMLRSYKPSIPVEFVQAQLGFKVTGGIDEMLNHSLGSNMAATDEDDDDDKWSAFADNLCLVSTPEDPTVLDCKATLDALSQAERQRAEERN